jgi:hypothetical protein
MMSMRMRKLESIRTYLDDLLIQNEKDFKDHLTTMEMVLVRLSEAGIKSMPRKQNSLQMKLRTWEIGLLAKGSNPYTISRGNI